MKKNSYNDDGNRDNMFVPIIGVINVIFMFIVIDIISKVLIKTETTDFFVSQGIRYTIGFIWVYFFLKKSGNSFSDVFGDEVDSNHIFNIIKYIIPFVMIAYGSVFIVIYGLSVFDEGFAYDFGKYISIKDFNELKMSLSYFMMYLLFSSLIVPVFEEIIWRGFIFNKLNEKYGYFISLILSSFMFSLFHIGPAILASFIHAVIYTVLYVRLKSLYPVILLHGLYNGITYSLQMGYGVSWSLSENMVGNITHWIPYVLCFVVGGIWLIYLLFEDCYPQQGGKLL